MEDSMSKNSQRVAIIPARGGSKRIPNKNIKKFFGKPIIHYSIDQALQSDLFGRVIVSTDSEEIAKTSRSAGAEVPFLRPPTIANDTAPIAEVLSHALNWLIENGESEIQSVCCILATAPFVQAKYLREGYQILREK